MLHHRRAMTRAGPHPQSTCESHIDSDLSRLAPLTKSADAGEGESLLHVSVEGGGFDVARALELQEYPILSRLREPIGQG